MESIVLNQDGEITTTSRIVAEKFEKRHSDVIRAVENLRTQDCVPEKYFKLVPYLSDRGRMLPEYQINRNGFSLLVMGFTGQKALEWKLKFIEAFDWMEEQLRKVQSPLVVDSYLIEDPAERARRWAEEYEEKRRITQTLEAERREKLILVKENSEQRDQIIEMEPKVEYFNNVLGSENSIPITDIAKEYSLSAYKMNRLLHEKRIQYKVGKTWVLYQEHTNKGYVKTETFPYIGKNGEQKADIQTRWTQKGRHFIYQTLKADGILPDAEKGL